MLCAFPWEHSISKAKLPCGQCIPCRINKQRAKVTRMLLEYRTHAAASFITTTYTPETLPQAWSLEDPGHRRGNLSPADLSGFIKRLRERLREAGHPPIRHFSVGEYGDTTERPHYHSILFGVSFDVLRAGDLLEKSWGAGRTHAVEATINTMQYVAGYLTKKWTNPLHLDLDGRHQEFSRASNDPGIGVPAVPWLASALRTKKGVELLAQSMDVPSQVWLQGRYWPLDPHMRMKLREELDIPLKSEDRPAPPPGSRMPFFPEEWEQKRAVGNHRKLLRGKAKKVKARHL